MLARELKRKVNDGMPESGSRRLCVIGCQVLWREMCHYAATSRHTFSFRFLDQGLHSVPDTLRAQLQHAIDEEDGKHDAILLAYGLCSNGIQGIVAGETPLVAVRAHDCITFLLGSKERYREYFDSHPGTYWYSPGWIECSPMPGEDRYHAALRVYTEMYGEESAVFLMEQSETWIQHYGNAAYVDLGVDGCDGHKAYTQRCAAWLKWDCDELEGDPSLVKAFVDGAWDEERFLVVQPGEEIAPSYEADILCARSKKD